MLSHKNLVIFSHPRSGTKLLAKILEDFGYYSYGEWFSLQTTTIENNKAVRRTDYLEDIWSVSEKQYKKIKEHIRRHNLYNKIDKSVITIWPESLTECPFILCNFEDHHWICLERDPWDTMLSYYISSKNQNFDGAINSKSCMFKEDAFRKIYWDYFKASEMQDWLIKNKSATVINFQDLISGNSNVFGKDYSVNSIDEHTDLESLVENINQVKEWFKNLEKIRASYKSWD